MKKIITLFLIFIFLWCFPICSFAQSTNYVITGTDISLSVPDDFIVFTRENIPDNEYLGSLGYSKSEYLNLMKQRNIYMEAIKLDESYTLILTVIKTTGKDFNGLSSNEQKGVIEDTKVAFSESNIVIDKSSFCKINNNNFLVLEYLRRSENDVIDVCCTQYSTVVNGYTYNISIDSFNGFLSGDSLTDVENIINSVRFNTAQQKEETGDGKLLNSTSVEGVLGGAIGIVLWSLITGFIARRKNRSFLAYFLLSFIITPLVTMVILLCMEKKEKDLPIDEMFEKSINEGIKRRETLFNGQNPEDPQFGYVPDKPICLATISSSKKYLNCLRTVNSDVPFTWERLGSLNIDVYGVECMPVDKYILTNTDIPGKEYVIYICPYGHDSNYVPKGMRLVEDLEKETDKNASDEIHEFIMNEEYVNQLVVDDEKLISETVNSGKTRIKVKVKKVSDKIQISKCPTCRKELLGFEKFCRKCGTEIIKEES